MLIKIEPFDTLFFRDGKPFSMGEQSTAYGIFPSHPSTVYGAIRTAIISQNNGFAEFCSGEMAGEIGTPEKITDASFFIRGVFLCKEDFIFFPVPFDLITTDDSNSTGKAFKTIIRNDPPFFTNMDFQKYLFSPEQEKSKSSVKNYLRDTDFTNYLLGSEKIFDVSPEKTFCDIEFKTGIKRNNKTMTALDGNLYRIGMRRFNNGCAIVCDISGAPSLKKEGVLKLGGEGKPVSYKEMDSAAIPDIAEAIIKKIKQNNNYLKLYFATPALFDNGCMPDEEIIKNSKYTLELVTASTGSHVPIGGWDMGKAGRNGRTGGHKPMIRAVPAGSVYYFKITNGTAETVINELHYKNHGRRAQQGFGLAFVGNV